MARLPRLCLPGTPHHVIQRGNNRQACFVDPNNYVAYASWLLEFSRQYRVAIHAWVFMTNHVHLLLTPESPDGIPQMMQCLGRQYVRYFNKLYGRTGTLWEGRYKSCVVNADEYLITCLKYIELNPVRAGMVESPADYFWSSYQAHGLGKEIEMWSPHALYQQLGSSSAKRCEAYKNLFVSSVDEDVIKKIRLASNRELVLGNGDFEQSVERATGRRVTLLKRGPKCAK